VNICTTQTAINTASRYSSAGCDSTVATGENRTQRFAGELGHLNPFTSQSWILGSDHASYTTATMAKAKFELARHFQHQGFTT